MAVFFPKEWNVSDFLAAYITFPIFLALYFGHKIWFATNHALRGTSWDGKPVTELSRTKLFFHNWIWATKIPDIDVISGKREMDALEEMDVPPVAKNWVQKFWYWLA